MSGQGNKWIPPPPTHRVLFRHHLIFLVTAEPPEPGPLFLGITGGTLSILAHAPSTEPAPLSAGWSRNTPALTSRAVQTPGAEHHLCHQETLPHIHSTVCAIKLTLRRWLRDAVPRAAAPRQLLRSICHLRAPRGCQGRGAAGQGGSGQQWGVHSLSFPHPTPAAPFPEHLQRFPARIPEIPRV